MKRLESVASPIHKSTPLTATITVSLPWVGLTVAQGNTILEITKIGDEDFVPIEYPLQSFSLSGAVFWLDREYWNLPKGMYEGKVKISGSEICRFAIEHKPRLIEKEQVPFGVQPSDASRIFVRFPFSG
jgi:hypothetical protein